MSPKLIVLGILAGLLTLTGCAGKMPPPIFDTIPIVEKTPKELKSSLRQEAQHKEKVAAQKKSKEKAKTALKELTQAISKARQERIDELSNYNFEMVRRLYKEVVDHLETELFAEAITTAKKAREILALAYEDAKLQREHKTELQQRETELKNLKAEADEQRKEEELAAVNAVKQAAAAVNKLEVRGTASQFPAVFKEAKVKLEDAFKLLKTGDFPIATAKASEVINTSIELDTKSRELAKLPPISQAVDNPQEWQEILGYLEKYDYGKTYFSLNEYLAKYPQTTHLDQAMFILGRCFEKFDSYDRALSAYARLIDRFPESPWTARAIFQSSLTYTAISNFHLAFLQRLRLDNLPQAKELGDLSLFAQGKLELAQKKYTPALNNFQTIIDQWPKSTLLPQAYKAAALCLVALERNDEAETMYWRIYEQYPQSEARKEITDLLSKLIYDEAREQTKALDFPPAREKYNLIIKDFPDSTLLDNATYWLAETYYVEGDFKNALALFSEVLQNDYYDYTDSGYLKDDDATLKIGYCYYNLKEYDKTIQTFGELIEDYPDSELKSDANYWLKLVQSRQKNK